MSALAAALLPLLVLLVVVGVLLYLFNQFVTMDARFKNAINVIVCLIVFLVILSRLWPLVSK